jgi:hypothetical protein
MLVDRVGSKTSLSIGCRSSHLCQNQAITIIQEQGEREKERLRKRERERERERRGGGVGFMAAAQ